MGSRSRESRVPSRGVIHLKILKMSSKLGKKRKAANSKVEGNKLYTLEDAMALVKQVNTTKFDASVDLHVRLGIDPRKADQALRG